MQHQGIDQHQVTQRHGACNHTITGINHHQSETYGDDATLTKIQQSHRGLTFNCRFFPLGQGIVIALEFKCFIIEVLDCLIIQQAVYGLTIGLRIQFVHGVAIMHTPLGHGERKGDIYRNRGKSDQGKMPFISTK